MKLKRYLIAAAGALALSATTAKAQTGYLYPRYNGGYTYIQPGSGEPPVQVNPGLNGSWQFLQPGQPPAYAYPNMGGGYRFVQPTMPPPIQPITPLQVPPCHFCE